MEHNMDVVFMSQTRSIIWWLLQIQKQIPFKGKESFCFGLQGAWIFIVVLVGNSVYIYIYEPRTTCKIRFLIINILDCEQLETKSEAWTTQIHN